MCIRDRAKNPALWQNGYLVDVRELASDLAGSAHVMVIDWDVTYEFSRIVGDEWSCFGGAVRIYWPELFDFETDDPYVHPLYTAQTIRRNFYPSEFEKELKKIIRARNAGQVIAWNRFGIRFYVEAEQMRMLSVSGEESTEDVYKRQSLFSLPPPLKATMCSSITEQLVVVVSLCISCLLYTSRCV